MTSRMIFAFINLLTFGWLARRRQRATRKAAASRVLGQEWKRINALRKFRRALHRATVWKTLDDHPGTKNLPRRVRRAVMFRGAHYAWRSGRGLPEIQSKGHARRLMRSAFDPSALLPVKSEGVSTVTLSAPTSGQAVRDLAASAAA